MRAHSSVWSERPAHNRLVVCSNHTGPIFGHVAGGLTVGHTAGNLRCGQPPCRPEVALPGAARFRAAHEYGAHRDQGGWGAPMTVGLTLDCGESTALD